MENRSAVINVLLFLTFPLRPSSAVTEGVNTLQRVYGCETDDNAPPRRYDKSIYNGKDFISLNLDTGTWTAVDERAKNFTENWNPAQNNAAFWKNFLERTCVDRLKSYIPHSTNKEPVTHTLEYSYTMVTPGSRFTSVALLDGEEFMYYDSNTAKMTPKTEWIKEVEPNSSFWERETQDVKFQRDWLIDKLNKIKGGAEGGTDVGAEERSAGGAEGGSDGQSDERKTAVNVVVVLVLVAVAAAVVGFVIYKKKLCAHLRSGYVAARQSAEQ